MASYITWASQIMQLEYSKTEDKYPFHNMVNRKVCSELINIWKESFRDSEDYIEKFFCNRFVPDHTIVAVNNGQIIGAAYLLPAEIITVQGKVPAMFGYALGVMKEHRGNDLGKRIVDFIRDYCEENDCVFLFYPANERLVGYYEDLGLTLAGSIKLLNYSYDSVPEARKLLLEEISPRDYAVLRNEFFYSEGYVKWDNAAIDYAISENKYCGGFCYKLIYQTVECVILGRRVEEKLIITEIIAPEHFIPEIVKALAAYYKILQVSVYVPVQNKLNGKIIKWIMGYKTQILTDSYCNLLLN